MGICIKELRIKAGLRQEDLIIPLGVQSSTAVSYYETGKRKLRAEQLPALAKTLGCTIGELFEAAAPPEESAIQT